MSNLLHIWWHQKKTAAKCLDYTWLHKEECPARKEQLHFLLYKQTNSSLIRKCTCSRTKDADAIIRIFKGEL